MESVGQYLRRQRESKRMSVEEVARSTRVPMPSVERIEADQFDELPGEVFVRGFLKSYARAVGLAADAREALRGLLEVLPSTPRPAWTDPKAPSVRREAWHIPGLDVIGPLRRVLPRDAIVVADITRLAYSMLVDFPVYQPRTFLHPAGFVAMAFGIPAALGAKTAFPDRTVVAVVGDGCFMMSGMELATAVQEKLPVLVVLINDGCLTLIKSTQERRYDRRFIAVDLQNPDIGKLCAAFGVRHRLADSDASFARGLEELLPCGEPAVLEVRPGG